MPRGVGFIVATGARGAYDTVPMTETTHNSEPAADRPVASILDPSDTFVHRHIGPSVLDVARML